ncbi:hypothetical protein FRC06_002212 [Ceratobasidium sp. 370]|nr:hypothetical protein FRC06_002212 [Ceratobasidium sp. 370]
MARGHVNTSSSTVGIGTAPAPIQPANPLTDASEDDIQALFGGLNNLHFGNGHAADGRHFPNFPNFPDSDSRPLRDRLAAHAHYPLGNGPQHSTQAPGAWEPLTTRQLDVAVNH